MCFIERRRVFQERVRERPGSSGLFVGSGSKSASVSKICRIRVWGFSLESDIKPPRVSITTAQTEGNRLTCSPSRTLDSLDLAAVHTDRSTSHPFRCRRHHESQQVCNFFWLPISSDPRCFWKLFRSLSSTLKLCAGAHFMKERRRPVITGPGTMLLTCTPSLIPCSANAFASAVIAALIAATAAKAGLGSSAASQGSTFPSRKNARVTDGLKCAPDCLAHGE